MSESVPTSGDRRGVALNQRQRAFAEIYDGNATEAARQAGYKGTRHSLEVTGSQLLRKPEVQAAIRSRTAGVSIARIATREERQAFWTRTLLDSSARMPDRLKASELLGRSQADFVDRLEHSVDASLEALLLAARARSGK